MGKIYNISATNSFVDEVARKFLHEYEYKPLELSEILILLPSRRACENLKNAFVRAKGLTPMLLPKFVPIGDMDEEAILFSDPLAMEELLPEISKTERLLLFTKIILSKPKEFGITDLSSRQACFLARELANLIDLANNERLSFEALKNIVPEEYSLYWQETVKFLEIITRFWPEILSERGLSDSSFRTCRLLEMQSAYWQQHGSSKKIVAAGITATYPAMKELLQTLLRLPNSEVILSGLDKEMQEEDWKAVDVSHPQFELKDLLDYLNISRQAVEEYVSSSNKPREMLVSEIMRPSETTDKWQEIGLRGISKEALHGLNVINCSDVRIEAITTALLLREASETPEKTAALVTTNRNLARRVSAELKRWGIDIDDSAGKPLNLTPIGQFLRLIIDVAESGFAPVETLALLKHPFTNCGQGYADFRKKVRDFELKVLRAGKNENILEIQDFFSELTAAFSQEKVELKTLLEKHLAVAERLSVGDVLWKGEAGEAMAGLIADLHEKAEILGEIEPAQYGGILEAFMGEITVRPKFGTHPRLSILGPIEARLVNFDMVIVGEVNEGSFPKIASADPWFSRQMREKFGLPPVEKAIGISAKDFASLLCNEQVYLVRADRVQGTPMVKSRWWMRLETVLRALDFEFMEVEDVAYKQWARYLDKADVLKRLLPPEPKPPVAARPRELPVSAIENLMRDPYIIFAKYILKLKPLDELEKDWSMADYGSLVHEVLEAFNKKYPCSFPKNAREEFLSLGKEVFERLEIPSETRVFWQPNFEKSIDWLIDVEEEYRLNVEKITSEAKGKYCFDAPAGEFCVTAKADRIDVLKNGKVNVIDYKTGQARSEKELFGGYSPQLPIEGLIASKGGFEGISVTDVESLIYWRLGKEAKVFDKDIVGLIEGNYENLKELISLFDFETTPYYSKPNPKLAPKYSDYEHLSRALEWSLAEDGDD